MRNNLAKVQQRAASSRLSSYNLATHSQRRSQVAHSSERIGRNEPCPCGSGKKYKRCCGL